MDYKEHRFWVRVWKDDDRRINGEYVKPLTRKDIPFLVYLKSRILSPVDIIRGFKNPVMTPDSIGKIIFNARYNAGPTKCIPGYDFF